MIERWRETYDQWKLATPPEYEGEDEPAEEQCPHPGDQIQSGICAPGINLPPTCLACGQHIASGEVIITQEPACQSK